jgi:hypothetical protein
MTSDLAGATFLRLNCRSTFLFCHSFNRYAAYAPIDIDGEAPEQRTNFRLSQRSFSCVEVTYCHGKSQYSSMRFWQGSGDALRTGGTSARHHTADHIRRALPG